MIPKIGDRKKRKLDSNHRYNLVFVVWMFSDGSCESFVTVDKLSVGLDQPLKPPFFQGGKERDFEKSV